LPPACRGSGHFPDASGAGVHARFSSPHAHGPRANLPALFSAVDAAHRRRSMGSREVGRGHRIHSRHCGPLRGLALDRVGDLALGRGAMSAMYIVSGVLALGLCAYLLYALFKPEKF
jgi:K+-transporting ATPase KdpF subunit